MRLSKTGRVTLPIPVLEEAGISLGADLEVRVENQAIVLRRKEPSPREREFAGHLAEVRRLGGEARGPSATTLKEVEGLSRGEQFVRLLADAGIGRLTTDEIMELTRGPYDDLDPR
jgi:bifunctional DNA-binding transcriptional regulator/antitoxin component of YhaV-PrlF toxin-antitoxin module